MSRDPYFGLKYIAYLRSGLPFDTADLDGESLLSFAKAQICKVRNKLWNDPVWDSYTPQEILIEFFTIQFDSNPELRTEFETKILKPIEKDIDWMENMARKHTEGLQKKDKIKEEDVMPQPEEFEDNYKV